MVESKRRVGRPRRNPRPLTRSPEDEILFHAARLFARNGFPGTTTREIAEAAGLSQSSLFHYFSTKDDILVALSERAHIRFQLMLDTVSSRPSSAPAKLFKVVELHMHYLCTDDGRFRALERSAHLLAKARFRNYLAAEEHYTNGIEAIVREGVASGELLPDDPDAATIRILGMCNWTMRWYRRSGPWGAAELADNYARAALRSVLTDTDTLEKYVEEARAIDPDGLLIAR